MDLKSFIRDVPDFPEPGIVFKDVTPLLQDAGAFKYTIDSLADRFKNESIDAIVAVEARGFLFGATLAYQLGKSIVLVRKPSKLPAETYKADYTLEYGSNTLEIHVDGVMPGQRVLILDDLLATGGTLEASAKLVERCGGVISGISTIIELMDLNGRSRLGGYDVFSLLQY